ncbi:MAG: glycerate kinase [Carboxylicivirga sp.]|nr:glycerate kinase [Carboxylicivirga sp.]
MKKIVIAPDKFKGSLTGIEFCEIVERGIRKHLDHVNIISCPLADGGDGTIEALRYFLDGSLVELKLNDPLFRSIEASYLLSADRHTAFIEMSAASGIRLLKKEELNPLLTSTYGTGEMIKDAMEKGAQHILLGIGGSATNDGGLGMAKALGYRFYDANNNELSGIGNDLNQLSHIDTSLVHPLLNQVSFEVACDVDNPLYGPQGAAFVYAPQKGADKNMVKRLDNGLINYHQVIERQMGINLQNIVGSGAAGGLGAGSIAFLGARLKSGIELIKAAANFDDKIKGVDWVITGEGKLDQQTFSGKVIKGIIDSLSSQKLAVFCGLSELKAQEQETMPFDYLDETSRYALNMNDSIENARKYLEMVAESFAQKQLG